MRIALDAMGGDHAPGEVVQGAIDAARQWGIHSILVGPSGLIDAELQRRGWQGAEITVQNAAEVITMEDEPTRAVKRKQDSSLVVGMKLAAGGEAAAFVSAGNTGALLAAGVLFAGRIPGVSRPAYGVVFPSPRGRYLLLDGGLNVDNRPQHLQQFAVMGSVYAEKVLGIPRPRVGLLNVGTEPGKGNELTRAAYPLLEQQPGIHFVGNVEARDVPAGAVDVVVCDGFVGNIYLKAVEGLAATLMRMIKDTLRSSTLGRIGGLLVRPSLKSLMVGLDYQEAGGAPLLGLKAPVIKCHGSSQARGIKNGLRVARDLAAGGAVALMEQQLLVLAPAGAPDGN